MFLRMFSGNTKIDAGPTMVLPQKSCCRFEYMAYVLQPFADVCVKNASCFDVMIIDSRSSAIFEGHYIEVRSLQKNLKKFFSAYNLSKRLKLICERVCQLERSHFKFPDSIMNFFHTVLPCAYNIVGYSRVHCPGAKLA